MMTMLVHMHDGTITGQPMRRLDLALTAIRSTCMLPCSRGRASRRPDIVPNSTRKQKAEFDSL
jgi:hypothetical protein